MDSTDTRRRLMAIARERLRDMPGAADRLQRDLDAAAGQVLLAAAAAMPPHYALGELTGHPKAAALIDAHLTGIIDRWAKAQPQPPAVQPLAPAPAGTARDAGMVRRALVAALLPEWPGIERDLSEGSRNGLTSAARRGGKWHMAPAREWAALHGRLTAAAAPPRSANWTGPVMRHKLR